MERSGKFWVEMGFSGSTWKGLEKLSAVHRPVLVGQKKSGTCNEVPDKLKPIEVLARKELPF